MVYFVNASVKKSYTTNSITFRGNLQNELHVVILVMYGMDPEIKFNN
jgi:hypothetical protein